VKPGGFAVFTLHRFIASLLTHPGMVMRKSWSINIRTHSIGKKNKPIDSLTERLGPVYWRGQHRHGRHDHRAALRTHPAWCVSRIGEGLDAFVNEKVDSTLPNGRRLLRQAAVEVAENAARVAATEVAHESACPGAAHQGS